MEMLILFCGRLFETRSPLLWILFEMEASQNYNLRFVNEIEQSVGKAANNFSSDFFKYEGIYRRISLYLSEIGINHAYKFRA
jgi:hypothetical protein